MCINAKELNKKIEEIQSLKKLRDEAQDNIDKLNAEVIEFLETNEDEYKEIGKKGKEVFKFIGNLFTATASIESRETVIAAEVKKILSTEDFQKVSKVSTYPVLRIK